MPSKPFLVSFSGYSLTYLLTPTWDIMLRAKTDPREPRVVNGDTGEGCWAPDETTQDLGLLPREERDPQPFPTEQAPWS